MAGIIRIKLMTLMLMIPFIGRPQISPTDSPYQSGKEIVENALKKLGGRQVVQGVKTIEIHYSSANYLLGQNNDAYQPTYAAATTGTLIFDRSHDYVAHDWYMRTSGANFWQRVLKRDGKVMFMDMLGALNPGKATPFPESSIRSYAQRIVPIWLYETLKDDSAFVYQGEKVIENEHYDVVELREQAGSKLYINRNTNLPYKIETHRDHAVYGPQVVDFIFESFRRVDGGLIIPNEIIVYVNGQKQISYLHTEVLVNSKVNDTLLHLPDGVKYAPEEVEPRITEVAPHIFFIENQISGYNTTFVEFNKYVVVLDAPIGRDYALQTQQFIHKKFPDKPVKWVVISHFHNDHISGLPQFVADGAGIIMSDKMEKFTNEFLNTSHTTLVNPLEGKKINPPVQRVKDKWSLEDKDMLMEVYQIGPNSHVNDMLMVYFPKEKILWQADMLIVGKEPGSLPPGEVMDEEFDATLKSLSLNSQNVAAILGIHCRPATMADHDEVVRNRRALIGSQP